MKKMILAAVAVAGLIGIANATGYTLCRNNQTKQVIVLPQGSFCPIGWMQVY